MYKDFSLSKCEVFGHEQCKLDQVCLEKKCEGKGLICEKCSSSNEHNGHIRMPLSHFLQQYKDINNYREQDTQLEQAAKDLQVIQEDLKAKLQGFVVIIKDEVDKTLERLKTSFDMDLKNIQQIKMTTNKYSLILNDIEKKNVTNAQDARKKVSELVSRIQVGANRRIQIDPQEEQNGQRIKLIQRNTMSARDNSKSQILNFTKEITNYLDSLYQFLSSTKNQNINNQSGGTFNQSMNNLTYQEGVLFGAGDGLYQTELNNMSINQRQLAVNQQLTLNSLRRLQFNHHQPIFQQNRSDRNRMKSNQAYQANSNIYQPNGTFQTPLLNQTNQTYRNQQQMMLGDLFNVPPLMHEFERNNENQFSQKRIAYSGIAIQQKDLSISPFRENIKIGNSPNRGGFAPNPFSKTLQEIASESPRTGAKVLDRSYSLTTNLGKANQSNINVTHRQYFNEGAESINASLLNQSNIRLQEDHSLAQSETLSPQGLSKSGNFARVTSTRAWWSAHTGPIRDITFIDHDKIASASDDGSVKIWDRLEGKLIVQLADHASSALVLAYNSSGRVLASGGLDRTIQIYRPVPSWECVNTFKGHTDRVTCLVFLNERILISGGNDHTVKIWDLEKGLLTSSLENPQLQRVSSMLVLQNKSLVVGYDKFLCAWDLKTNQILKKVEAHASQIVQLLFIKGKKHGQPLLISAGRDSSVKVWEASTFIQLVSFEEALMINDIAYLADIDTLAISLAGSQGEGRIGLWSMSEFRKLKELSDNPFISNRLLYDENHKLLYSAYANQVIEYSHIIL